MEGKYQLHLDSSDIPDPYYSNFMSGFGTEAVLVAVVIYRLLAMENTRPY